MAEVTEFLLGRLARKVYPEEARLEKFANTLIGVGSARFSHILDGAGRDSWRRCFYVLLEWYNQKNRTTGDLYDLLREAERLQFVESGTMKFLLEGKVWDSSYLEKWNTGPYPDFARLVAPWYTDIIWQNMLLFPWMDEEALLLSEAHSSMEMVSHQGRFRRARTVPLPGPLDLFTGIQPQGTRILVRGDPGTGKTTFVHKIAFDSATGKLDIFDVVLVLKLKFAEMGQSIAEMLKSQIKSLWEESDVTPEVIEKYMKSGRDRVLLVLDGVDEINTNDFQEVKDVLTGQAYRKCCILTTTRPYVAETLNNKMTMIANITGFSRDLAEQFISHILVETEEREQFFRELDSKNIADMYRIPMLLQASALLFLEEQKLPETMTEMYDQLVYFLRRTCEESRELTGEELRAAQDEVDQLAFRGITRSQKQLVFDRHEIKNENCLKLGTLTAVKAGSGFRPTTVLEFLHKTFQEFSVADHVVTNLVSDNRGPWETLKQLIRREIQATKEAPGSGSPPRSRPLARLGRPKSRSREDVNSADVNNKEIANNNKTLLKFMAGKLFQKLTQEIVDENFVLDILKEMSELVVDMYLGENPDLPFEVFSNFMKDLMLEAGANQDTETYDPQSGDELSHAKIYVESAVLTNMSEMYQKAKSIKS